MNFRQLPILIGNGPSVKDHCWGEIIDSFDTVIRVNSFPLTGYELEAGKRCDLWALTPTKVRPISPCKEIYAFVISPDNATRQREYAISEYRDRFTLVDRQEVIQIAHPFGYTRMESIWPSTGATAMIYFSAKFPFIVYHGFDHLVGAESGTQHYYPVNGAPLYGVHVPQMEQAVFETLVSRGRAAKLSDLLQDEERC